MSGWRCSFFIGVKTPTRRKSLTVLWNGEWMQMLFSLWCCTQHIVAQHLAVYRSIALRLKQRCEASSQRRAVTWGSSGTSWVVWVKWKEVMNPRQHPFSNNPVHTLIFFSTYSPLQIGRITGWSRQCCASDQTSSSSWLHVNDTCEEEIFTVCAEISRMHWLD